MQKLLLASNGLVAIKQFIKQDPRSLRLLFIPTAGNPYDNIWWIDKDKAVLSEMGFIITELDIANKTTDVLQLAIKKTDMVYIAGGNTFYLMQQIRKTGFDVLLKDFIESGGPYAGASAGAIIAGPNIEPARKFDDPEHEIDLDSSEGLGFVNFIPFPHYDMTERTPLINEVIDQYKDTNKIVPITDDQVIIVEGVNYKVIDSIRTKRELEWPHDE